MKTHRQAALDFAISYHAYHDLMRLPARTLQDHRQRVAWGEMLLADAKAVGFTKSEFDPDPVVAVVATAKRNLRSAA